MLCFICRRNGEWIGEMATHAQTRSYFTPSPRRKQEPIRGRRPAKLDNMLTDFPERQSRNGRGICHKRTQRSQRKCCISPCLWVLCVPLRQKLVGNAQLFHTVVRIATDKAEPPNLSPSVAFCGRLWTPRAFALNAPRSGGETPPLPRLHLTMHSISYAQKFSM